MSGRSGVCCFSNLIDLHLHHTLLIHTSRWRRYGDCIQAGWTNVLELIMCFYRLQMLPDTFAKALNGDGDVRRGEGFIPH